MKTFSKLLSAMVCGMLALSAYAESQEYFALDYLAVDTGYRWDKLTNRATLGGATIAVKGSSQSFNKVNSYQLGAKGQASFCDYAFVKGAAHYGWVFNGKYGEGGFFGDTDGYTWDANAAVGYYFSLTDTIWIAPIIGWSFDFLNLKGTHISTAIAGVKYNHLSDIKAYQEFMGPFVGFDLVYQINNCFDFIFGYEFHYANWHGKRAIQGPEYGNPPFGATTGFSNKRMIDRVYGQVFKLDGTYQMCEDWIVGIGLKYQFYNGDFGSYKRTKVPLISQFDYAKVDGLWWSSFASTIYIGKVF